MNYDLDTLHLERGKHHAAEYGVCLMEAVAYVAGEPHTDHPQCVSRVLTSFGISLNDVLDYYHRQDLKPLIPELIGTEGDGLDEARGYLAMDWRLRTWLPTLLNLANLNEEAEELRSLAQIVDFDTATAAAPIVLAVKSKARAARAAAWDANKAGFLAINAGLYAAHALLGLAVGVTWVIDDANRPAAWDFAFVAGGNAARAAGIEVVQAAQAGDDDYDVSPVWDALQPTINQLQDSAIQLYARMITGALNQ